MSAKNYETMVVFSVANGEEAVQALIEKFKAMIEAVEQTNNGFRWTWDEQKLVGKGIGMVLREEEYENRKGEVKTRIKPYAFCTAMDIRTGNFTVPEIKTLDHVTATPTFTEEEDTGVLPF